MLIRCARSLAVAIAAIFLVLNVAAQAQTAEISLEQGYRLTAQALRDGDNRLALQLSNALIEARSGDPLLYYMRASAQGNLGLYGDGRRSAARAYRLSDGSPARFEAAQLAARLAVAEKRHTLAQIWLRRTAIHAPDEQAEALIARDYRALRRINPWEFRLRTELRPSNNVNNGADTALQIIDGVPVIGRLSGSAQALSGLIANVDLITAYRLSDRERSFTTLAGRLFVQRVELSSEAREQAPDLRSSDFDSTYVEAQLRHVFAVGRPGYGGSASAELAGGSYYYNGTVNYNFGRLGGARTWRRSDGSRIQVSALVETRFDALFRTNEADIFGASVYYFRPLQGGDNISLRLAYRDTQAEHPNGTFRSGSLRLAYGLGRPVGPARLDFGLVLGYSDYPQYISAGFLPVPGGRQDESIYGDVNLFFDRYDYAGFAPILRLRAGKKSSNDSRFDITEFSVSLGIESKF